MRHVVLVAALALASFVARAEDAIVTVKVLSLDTAQELARRALDDCRGRGYQVAVAVVDRFGVAQVGLRDRFAGPHRAATAAGQAWTAVSFRAHTSDLLAISQPGMQQAGIRHLPQAVVIGGGRLIEAQGSLLGAVGVSGAPGGPEDDKCAQAAIEAMRDKLDF